MRATRLVPTTAAGEAAALLAAWGSFGLLSAVVERNLPLAGSAAGTMALAGVVALLPWQRWRASRVLCLIVPVCLVVAASVRDGLIPIRAYGTVFVLLFAWVGANQPPKTALKVLPLIAAGYVLPIVTFENQVPLDPRALVLVMAVGVVVGELVAHILMVSHHAEARAEHTAHIFRTLSRSSLSVRTLEPVEVLDAVAATVMDLGYDGANLAVLDLDRHTFRPAHAYGLTASFEGQEFSLDTGTTGKVVATGQVQVWRDYAQSPDALPTIVESRIRSSISVPVFTNGTITAVLHASKLQPLDPSDEDVDALKILATTAGIALENANRFGVEQAAAKTHAADALTDELTGLRNRRHAKNLLSALQPGDVVVIADLDRFKLVNDRHGHQAGDALLVEFADHVTTQMRGGDTLCRYGGEEFLIVMPRTPLAAATVAVNRLMETWRATEPVTTFSAGVARHDAQRERISTLGAADQALYDAKRTGRDRCCVEDYRDQSVAHAAEPVMGTVTPLHGNGATA